MELVAYAKKWMFVALCDAICLSYTYLPNNYRYITYLYNMPKVEIKIGELAVFNVIQVGSNSNSHDMTVMLHLSFISL